MIREATAGVVIGKVAEVDDPEGLGRIKVTFPWLEEGTKSRWASVAAIMAGPERGGFFMPELDDEVLLAFEQGDWDHPYVIGFLWNPVQKPPSRDIKHRLIKSVNGHRVSFIDSPPNAGDKGALIIEDAHGNKIEMTNAKITIRGVGMLDIQAPTVTINGRVVAPSANPI